MKYRLRNITLNILTIFLGLVILGQVISLFLSDLFRNDSIIELKVDATQSVDVVKKTGYLDLIGGNVTIDFSKQITINNKADFVNVFNDYFEQLKQNGGYSIKSTGMVVGSATVLGSPMTVYQATQSSFVVDKDGNNFSETISVEVPSPSGNVTGYGLSVGKRIWIDGNVQTEQQTEAVTYLDDGGSYTIFANYDGKGQKEVAKNRETSLLPFIVSIDSIKDFSVEENAMSYVISLDLNFAGYEQIAIDTMEQGGAVKLPDFETFKVDVVISKLGKVVSMSVSQNYIITVKRLGFNIDSMAQSFSNYVIKKEENE